MYACLYYVLLYVHVGWGKMPFIISDFGQSVYSLGKYTVKGVPMSSVIKNKEQGNLNQML